MQIKTVSIDDLKPSPYNPRKDLQPGDPEYDKLKKAILEFDYVDPIVWNKQTKNIVGGHQRLKILRELGRDKLQVSVVDLDIESEKVLNLAKKLFLEKKWQTIKAKAENRNRHI